MLTLSNGTKVTIIKESSLLVHVKSEDGELYLLSKKHQKGSLLLNGVSVI